MPDHGKYDYDITTGRRTNDPRDSERGGGRSRSSGSIFGGGSRERDDERDERSKGGGWTEERENLGPGGGKQSGGGGRSEQDMHLDRGGEHGRRDQGERRSSGWGPDLGFRNRDGHRDRDEERGRSSDRGPRSEHEQQDDRNRGYGRDDERGGLPIEETSRLIGSNKVEGTTVYGRDGHRLGTIFNFMVDKLSGKVEYAVMKYGGMLGMGQRYYPLPWQMLTYDTREGGYRIDMTERDLQDAPSFDRDTEPQFDQSYGERVHSWYGLGRR